MTTITDTIALFTVFVSYELEYSDHMIAKERKMLSQTIRAFARTIDMRDHYTGSHSERVAKYARMLARRMKLSKETTRRVYQMALLHDVGKIGVDDTVLRKTTPLSPDEYSKIKTHAIKGSEILRNITEMPELARGARWHHERYDGKGYPDGLGGSAIPLEVRIIGVADSYDAMTSNRSYAAIYRRKWYAPKSSATRGRSLTRRWRNVCWKSWTKTRATRFTSESASP